jgi:hypothetical protein
MVYCFKCKASAPRFYHKSVGVKSMRRLCDACYKVLPMAAKPQWRRTGRQYCEECDRVASYGHSPRKLTRCDKHKGMRMKQWRKSNACCVVRRCPQAALYSTSSSSKPTHCTRHADHSLHTKCYVPKCASCGLFRVDNKAAKCSFCRPDSKRRRVSKEHKVSLAVLDALGASAVVSLNKTVRPASSDGDDPCRAFRPDILIDCGTHFLVVEVDERQHELYDVDCEVARMFTLQQQLGLPTIFVRLNVDAFCLDGVKQSVSLNVRIAMLTSMVKRLQGTVPCASTQPVTPMFLFYDDGGNAAWDRMRGAIQTLKL